MNVRCGRGEGRGVDLAIFSGGIRFNCSQERGLSRYGS